MISLYGATAEVHDHITRNPGSFEAVMRGISCLREAGAGFTVQLTPMQDNYHQLQDMINLAESLSAHWRFGASWFYLSASDDPGRNQEIMHQRLDPAKLVRLNNADVSQKREKEKADVYVSYQLKEDCRLLAKCIASRNVFHIDPYGQMTFCAFIKDPALRYNLREGSFVEGWDEFIPSLADKVRGGREYLENCGSCEIREDCYWCSVYSYLEHRRYSARIEYLCSIARESATRSCRFRQDEVCQ